MSDPARGWNGILGEGEEVLWQGQPEGGVDWGSAFSTLTLAGVFFTGFSVFWMSMAGAIISDGDVPFPFNIFPLFGLPFLAIGLWMLGGHLLFDAWRRSHSWYTLTNQTAFVASDFFGQKRLKSYPLGEMQSVEWTQGNPGSIRFDLGQGGGRDQSLTSARPGFYKIHEAQHVYGALRKARRALRGART